MAEADEQRPEKDRPPARAEPLTARPIYLEDERDTVSLLELVNALLRHWRPALGLTLGTALAAVAVVLILPNKYTTTASFTPESGQQRQLSRLSGLASQFGFSLPGGATGESPSFYAELVRSEAVLKQVVTTEYSVPEDDGTGEADLVQIFEVRGQTPAIRVEKAARRLRDLTDVSTGVETGVVTLSVTTRWPELSAAIGQRLIELVNQFNLDRRQSQASAERRFLEERVADARQDLLVAEDSLERFLERNRSYQNSPALRFQHDRLQRRVSLQQQIYSSLAESYEQAKIAEVRNTPVITVVTPPERPARPDGKALPLVAGAGLVAGGLLALLWIAGREFIGGAAQREPETYRQFRRLLVDIRESLVGIWRRLRQVTSGTERSS